MLVVRRSALEAAHDALGATYVDALVRWPLRYGADVEEAAEAAGGAGIAEIGPFDELLLRGPDAVDVAGRAVGSAVAIGRLHAGLATSEPVEGWALGPDEVLLVAPVGGSTLARIAAAGDSDALSAIDVTGSRTSLRIAGPRAADIIAELCPVDLTPALFAEGAVAQVPMAGVRAFVACRDAVVGPGYTLMVARDEAAYLWDAFLDVGAAHGIVPVGPAAVAPSSAGGSR